MAYTVMNTDGLGQGLQSLAGIFSQGPSMAVEADLKRNQRNQIVAATAIDQQAYQRKAASDTRSKDFQAWLTQPGIADILSTPEGRAELAAGLTLFSDQGPVAGNAPDVLGIASQIAPNRYGSDADLTRAGGPAFQNSPTGVAASLATEIEKQKVANLGELQKTALSSILGGSAADLMDVDAADAVALEASVQSYIDNNLQGKVLDPSVRAALLAETGREAAASHSVVGAVERAAKRLNLLDRPREKPRVGFGGTLYDQFFGPSTELYVDPDDPTASPAAASPTTAVGNQAVQQVLEALDMDDLVEGIGGGPTDSNGNQAVIPVGGTVPDAILPTWLRDPNIPDGRVFQSATPGMPKVKKVNGQYVRIE